MEPRQEGAQTHGHLDKKEHMQDNKQDVWQYELRSKTLKWDAKQKCIYAWEKQTNKIRLKKADRVETDEVKEREEKQARL